MALSSEYILSSLNNLYGSEVVAADIRAWCAMSGTTYQTVTKKLDDYKVGRGKWNLTVKEKLEQSFDAPAGQPAFEQNLIPAKDDTFVPFGNFTDIKKIIKSNLFYPAFITGLSGNGKTFCVEQACAQLGRELIRVNILLVGFVLLMGQLYGIMDLSLKHSKEEQSCYWMKLTLLQTKSSVSNPFLKAKVCF